MFNSYFMDLRKEADSFHHKEGEAYPRSEYKVNSHPLTVPPFAFERTHGSSFQDRFESKPFLFYTYIFSLPCYDFKRYSARTELVLKSISSVNFLKSSIEIKFNSFGSNSFF